VKGKVQLVSGGKISKLRRGEKDGEEGDDRKEVLELRCRDTKMSCIIEPARQEEKGSRCGRGKTAKRFDEGRLLYKK